MIDDICMSPLEFVAFVCKLTRMETDRAQKEERLPHDIFVFEEGVTQIPRMQAGECCQSAKGECDENSD